MGWDEALAGVRKKIASTPVVGDWDAALSAGGGKIAERAPSSPIIPQSDPKYDPNVGEGEYLWNELKKVPGGLVGLAPDSVEWLANKAIGAPTDFGNVTRKLQELSGADTKMRPPGPGSEKAGIMVQNVAGSAPFAAAALPARGIAGAATEILSGVTGGIGQLVGKEVAGSDNPTAQLVGNLIGSAMGYRAGNVAESAIDIGKYAFKSVADKEARAATALKAKGLIEGTPEYQQALGINVEAAKNEVLSDISKAYAQEDITAVSKLLDNYEAIKQKMPGFKASVGEITGNEPVLAMQSKLESRNIPALEERGARIRGNQKAIEDARTNLVPNAPGAGRAALNSAQSSLDEQLHALGARESAMASDLADASGKMADSAIPTAEAGGAIKAASKEGYLKSRGVANEKYQAFRNAIGEDAPSDASNVVDKVTELGNKFSFDKQPEVLGLVKGAAGEQSQLSVTQLDDLSSVANRDIQREMSKSNPDRKVIAQLQEIKREARSAIEKTLGERGNADALEKYKEANRYFSQEHAPKYLEGVNLKLRLKDAVNEERVKPESVVSAYFKPNGTTEARRFNQQFADNGAAKETLARGVFDLYKKEVIDKAGTITAANHDRFMRKYQATLKEYPWIAKRLEKNAVVGEIAGRMDGVRAQRGAIATSDLAKAIGSKDVDSFINKAMSDKRFMLGALSKMKPEDRKNMAIAVLNKAWDEGGKGSAAVDKVLNNEDNLKILLKYGFGAEGKNHLENVKLLARALKINESAPKTSPMTALSEDSLKGLTGTSWLQVMSAFRAMGRRPGTGDWFAMVFGGQFIKAKIDAKKVEILKQQLFDPELLQATLREYRAKNGNAALNMGAQASERAKQFQSKLWDLSKRAVGKDAPTAALKRLPVAAVSTEDQ